MADDNSHRAKLITGRIKVHPDGFGFVVPDDRSEDIHVAARSRGAAMDSDRVEVEWWVGARGLEGRVLKVVERGRGKITGQIVGEGKTLRLEPDDPRISSPVTLQGGSGGAQAGQAVVAEIVRYPDRPDGPLEVVVRKVLGDPDDPLTEIEKILAVDDIDEKFPEAVAALGAATPQEVRPEDRVDREDLTHVPFVTIDPETARDFDDAVALEPRPDGGYRLWVAVADVSHYVRPGDPIDIEAESRGCSVYLPNRAIPMLPEQLSGNICSLVAEEDRLAMVARIDIDRNAAVVDTDFCAAVIHSRARLDYPGVAAALGGDTRGKRRKYEKHLSTLRVMDNLATRMRERRRLRGALDLDLPETVVELDRDDPRLVRDIRASRRDPGERKAYQMIEEFMLAANEAVGASFQKRGDPTIWRVHDVPDQEKMETFATLAERYGISIDVEEARTPVGLQKVLERLRGMPAEKPLSFQLLRSLKQATYEIVNIGHFGLASSAYIHFTSPIRRYPDVMAHRLLKHRLASQGKPAGGFKPMPPEAGEALTNALIKAAADASFSERKAMEVEREVVNLYRAYFLRDRVGDVFDGTISGVASFGVFVTVDDPFVEGLVRVDYLVPDDYYIFDDVALRMVGRRTGRAFSLGDRVRVEVVSASVARRKIDYRLAERQPESSAGATVASDGKPRRRTRGDKRAAKHERGARDDRPAPREERAKSPRKPVKAKPEKARPRPAARKGGAKRPRKR
jgi:ribonuclease R